MLHWFKSVIVSWSDSVMKITVPYLMQDKSFKEASMNLIHPIDNNNNLVFWCCFSNKLEPLHIVYIMQQ